MDCTQVALIDDHTLFRNGLARMVNCYPGYHVLLEADNGEDFIRKISKKFKPDLVLLDISMPVMDGPATATWLRQNFPEIAILVLSTFDDDEKVLSMISLGVKGYILKDSKEDEFINALNLVSDSGTYFPAFVTKHLVKNFNTRNEKINLNPREIDFLKLSCSELTYKEIAGKMNVSARTVDGYRDQLFEKIHVKNRVGLVLYAIKNKFVEL
ncbi:MAG: response regulator transcription factor [Flavobacterium sp.]|nr:response regulator transcription factor [Pedobacter sp.]